MSAIQFVRQKLGISFAQLADYFALPISQLSMSQSGRRTLPAKANVLLMRLVNAINKLEPNVANTNVKPTGLETAQLNRQILDKIQVTTLQLATAKKNMAILNQKHQQGQLFLSVANYLNENPITGSEATREELWLNALIGDANDIITKTNYANRAFLELQIKTLEFTLAETKKMQLSQ
ncbi:MAG: hypothetical protein QM541_14005 [Flavobacterium sp.]|nr:hypothetical protein [Flavobacterium sp.]